MQRPGQKCRLEEGVYVKDHTREGTVKVHLALQQRPGHKCRLEEGVYVKDHTRERTAKMHS